MRSTALAGRESLVEECSAEIDQLLSMGKMHADFKTILDIETDPESMSKLAGQLSSNASQGLSDSVKERLWLAGLSDRKPSSWGWYEVRLRVLFDGENNWVVNTSRSATVPQTTVKRLWRLMKAMAHRNTPHFLDRDLMADPYRGVEVKFGEDLTVGCHVIPWDQIEYVRSVLEERFGNEWAW